MILDRCVILDNLSVDISASQMQCKEVLMCSRNASHYIATGRDRQAWCHKASRCLAAML